MGTRADFYVGRGVDAEWLGSIALDGYPDAPGRPLEFGITTASTEEDYRERVAKLTETLDHGTRPEDGWPWPWKDSSTTDYAYAFSEGAVWASGFGGPWFKATDEQPEKPKGPRAVFPDMESRSAPTLGPRSGLIVVSGP